LIKVPYPPQIELAATARLISPFVKEGICETAIEKEIVIRYIHSLDLIAQLLDPAWDSGAHGNPYPVRFRSTANDLRLKRDLILDFFPTFFSSLVQDLKFKFGEI
jgi:hypothetical protein